MIDVVPGYTDEFLEPLRHLVVELADSEGIALDGSLLTEIIELPGECAPPRGTTVVAFEAGHIAGCGMLRDVGQGACEIRRLYVREEYRSAGVGKRILARLLGAAEEIGYGNVRIDLSTCMAPTVEAALEAGFSAGEGRVVERRV